MERNTRTVMKETKQEAGQLTTVPVVATTPKLEGQREEVM